MNRSEGSEMSLKVNASCVSSMHTPLTNLLEPARGGTPMPLGAETSPTLVHMCIDSSENFITMYIHNTTESKQNARVIITDRSTALTFDADSHAQLNHRRGDVVVLEDGQFVGIVIGAHSNVLKVTIASDVGVEGARLYLRNTNYCGCAGSYHDPRLSTNAAVQYIGSCSGVQREQPPPHHVINVEVKALQSAPMRVLSSVPIGGDVCIYAHHSDNSRGLLFDGFYN